MYAIKKPWKAPIKVPIKRQRQIASQTGIPRFTMNTPASAPTRATTEPTDKSMLPPVRIHKSIPVARIAT